jgi:hypothetical protein
MSDIEKILRDWSDAKKKSEKLEDNIKEYKRLISKEMNRQESDKISAGKYTVTRRRNTRTYITKDNLPEDIWKKYSTRCSYDALFLTDKGDK